MKNSKEHPGMILQQLNQAALVHASTDNQMTLESLMSIPLDGGNRRNKHDDITILLINLENQV
jgi:hypothetical protein